MRKIVQISTIENSLFALCNDGSIWRSSKELYRNGWKRLKQIPQDDCSNLKCNNLSLTTPTIIQLKNWQAEVYLCKECSTKPDILGNVPTPCINIIRPALYSQSLYSGLTEQPEIDKNNFN